MRAAPASPSASWIFGSNILRACWTGSTLIHRKVSDVAFACGFNDLSYFHRCFRRRFGMTPAGARAG